ncbi:unnamed protein product, partial [marine sediment metagenome]
IALDERVIEVQTEKRTVISDILNDERLTGKGVVNMLPMKMGELSASFEI